MKDSVDKLPIISLFVSGLALTAAGVSAYVALTSKWDTQAALASTLSSVSVSLDKISSESSIGKPLTAEYHLSNDGDKPVTLIAEATVLEFSSSTPPTVQDQLRMLGPNPIHRTVHQHGSLAGTASSLPLLQDQLNSIENGSAGVLFLDQLVYRDYSGNEHSSFTCNLDIVDRMQHWQHQLCEAPSDD